MNYSPKKRITLADVAARAKVDKSTASLVLNGRALASRLLPETRQRILDAALSILGASSEDSDVRIRIICFSSSTDS